MAHQELMPQMFDTLVQRLAELLPDYGVSLAVDGKALPSYTRGKSKVPADEEHSDPRGSARLHAPCAQQPKVGALLRQTHRSRTGQQPPGHELRLPEAQDSGTDEDVHPLLPGVGSDAGHSIGADQGQQSGGDAQSAESRLRGAKEGPRGQRPREQFARGMGMSAHGS